MAFVNAAPASPITDPDKTTLLQEVVSGSPPYPIGYEDSLWIVGQPYVVYYPNASSNTFTYTDGSGNTQTVTPQYTSYTLATNFGCSGFADYLAQSASDLLTNLTTPAGTYIFSYEKTPGSQFQGNGPYGAYSTGRIAQITLPSGGYVQYGYSGGNNGINCSSGVVPTLTRTVYDNNGNVSPWKYVNNNTTDRDLSPVNFTVIKTDPANNQAVYNFVGEFQTQATALSGRLSDEHSRMCRWGDVATHHYNVL